MTDAAAAIDEVSRVAREMRRMSTEEVLDPNERVHISQRNAGRLERAAATIAEALSRITRQVTPSTTRPCERRRIMPGKKGRIVVVESRRS